MGKFVIQGGDFIKGATPPCFRGGYFTLCTEAHPWMGESVSARDIQHIELLVESNGKRLGRSLIWGAAGSLTLGPIGGLAGIVLGGKGTDVTFHCMFRDGRNLVAIVDSNTYSAIRGAMFQAGMKSTTVNKPSQQHRADAFPTPSSETLPEAPPGKVVHRVYRWDERIGQARDQYYYEDKKGHWVFVKQPPDRS